MPQDPFLASTLLTDWGIWLPLALIVVLLGVVAWLSIRRAFQPAVAAGPGAGTAPRTGTTGGGLGRRRTGAAPSRPRRRHATFAWLRPNPADAYLREPRAAPRSARRAAACWGSSSSRLVFRLWRLDVPRGHHFDEVYHARSATEWLSNWQNGWDRDVYEWTHPMLAKYLIAAGIVVADPNKVVGSSRPRRALARRSRSPRSARRLGRDRSVVFTAAGGGATIVASDAETGDELARWDAGGPIAASPTTRMRRGCWSAAPTAARSRPTSWPACWRRPTAALRRPARRSTPSSRASARSTCRATPTSSSSAARRGRRSSTGRPMRSDGIGRRHVRRHGLGPRHRRGQRLRGGHRSGPQRRRLPRRRDAAAELDAEGSELGIVPLDAPLVGPLLVRGSGDDQQLLALTGPSPANDEHPATAGGLASIDADAQIADRPRSAPGRRRRSSATRRSPTSSTWPASSPDGEPVVWPIEPHIDDRATTRAPASPPSTRRRFRRRRWRWPSTSAPTARATTTAASS